MTVTPSVIKTVIVEREFAHTPEKVWRALPPAVSTVPLTTLPMA